MNTYALLTKINEETKLHEKRLQKAMTEENENLRESIKKIKQNMERTLFYSDIPNNKLNNNGNSSSSSSHLKTTSNIKHINIYKCLSPLSIGMNHNNSRNKNLFLSHNTKRTYKVNKEHLKTRTENDIKQARQQYLIRMNDKWKNAQESNTVKYKKRKRICLSNDFDNNNNIKVAHLGSARQFLNGIVNRVVDRSLYIYNNKNCHSCTKSLSKGKSTKNCPKCH